MRRVFATTSYRLLFCLWLITVSGAVFAENKEIPFSFNTEGLLFTMAGSNTVGAHLAPAWAKAYLKSKPMAYQSGWLACENNLENRTLNAPESIRKQYENGYGDCVANIECLTNQPEQEIA